MTITDLAPTGSIRWGGLPYADSEQLGSREIVEALRELQLCEDAEFTARASAVDGLHSLVPSLAKGPERYAALDLKRALHRGIDAEEIRGMDDLPDAVKVPGPIATYLECRSDLLAARETFASTVATTEAIAGKALRGHLDHGDFGRAIALLSPRLFNGSSHEDLAEPWGKSTRSLTSYFAQATRKTSPMSYLGIQAPTRVTTSPGAAAANAGPQDVFSYFEPNQPLPEYASAADDATLHCLQPAAANEVQTSPGWIRATGLGTDRSRKVAEQVLDLTLYAEDLRMLQGRTIAEARTDLADKGLEGENARAWIEYLALAGMVSIAGGQTHGDDPAHGDDQAHALPSSAKERAALGTAATASNVERQPAGYENVVARSTDIELPDGLAEDLRQFVLARRILHPVYRWSKKNFLDWYGAEAEGVRVDDFIARSYVDYGFTGTAKATPEENIYDQPIAADPIPDVPVVYTAFLQAVPPEQGGGFVLNRLLAGIFVGSNRTQDAEGVTDIRDWLNETVVDGELLELAIGERWLPLQRLTGLGPTLTTDPEPSDLALHEVFVSYDNSTDRLRLQREDGTPITAMYTGFIPPLLLPGPAGQLCALAQPMALQSSDDFDNIVTGATTAHVPRARRGELVTRRASWLIKAGEIPEPTKDSAAYLRAWLEALDAAGAPHAGFLYIVPKENPARTPRKPLVYDATSPHFMAAIESALAKAPDRDVVLVECLPAPPSNEDGRVQEIVVLGVAHV